MANTTPTALSVADQLDVVDSRLVQKHGTQILAIADYSADVPAAWFITDGGVTLPAVLPAYYRNMGYITTDGIQESNDVSTSDVQMVQDIQPVRSDIDGMTTTLKATFGEASGYTKSLYAGLPVAQWPTDKAAAWEVHRGDRNDFPYYRILILTQDGTGADAIYRVEFAYRAKVTDLGDRTMNRTDAETTEFTFTCYKDPAVGRSYTSASSGVPGEVA